MKPITKTPDELSQKIEKINARIKAHLQTGCIKSKRINKSIISAPGLWSER